MKAIIVDDERLARKELKNLLSKYPNVEVIGEYDNAEDAINEIEKQKPDLVFLDIHMPGKDGLLHISQFKQDFEHLTDVINEGDNIRVKVTEIRRDGKVKLEFADSE